MYEINVNSSNEYFSALNGVLFNKDKSELICYPAGRKVSTNYEIPGVVKHIGIGAFYNCSVLENVVIPTSVDSIGDSAFYNCSSLEDIDIPRNVSSVGANAFKGTAMLNYQIANAGPLYYADTWVIGSTSGIETIIDGSTPIQQVLQIIRSEAVPSFQTLQFLTLLSISEIPHLKTAANWL